MTALGVTFPLAVISAALTKCPKVIYVRFWSAFGGKADIDQYGVDVRFVPIADVTSPNARSAKSGKQVAPSLATNGTSSDLLDWRRVPTSVDRLLLRRIEPHRQSEFPAFWCWQPIRLLVGAGFLVLNVEVE